MDHVVLPPSFYPYFFLVFHNDGRMTIVHNLNESLKLFVPIQRRWATGIDISDNIYSASRVLIEMDALIFLEALVLSIELRGSFYHFP